MVVFRKMPTLRKRFEKNASPLVGSLGSISAKIHYNEFSFQLLDIYGIETYYFTQRTGGYFSAS